jgi:hypothetical protein
MIQMRRLSKVTPRRGGNAVGAVSRYPVDAFISDLLRVHQISLLGDYNSRE